MFYPSSYKPQKTYSNTFMYTQNLENKLENAIKLYAGDAYEK